MSAHFFTRGMTVELVGPMWPVDEPDMTGTRVLVEADDLGGWFMDEGGTRWWVDHNPGSRWEGRPVSPQKRINLCINVWDGDVYGNGEEPGPRYTVYEDDPKEGAVTHEFYSRGPIPDLPSKIVQEARATDDDWLYGIDAVEFLTRVEPDRVIEVVGGYGTLKVIES